MHFHKEDDCYDSDLYSDPLHRYQAFANQKWKKLADAVLDNKISDEQLQLVGIDPEIETQLD